MNLRQDLTTTSVSMPSELLDQARAKAARSFRSLSQYISFLVDQDINGQKNKNKSNEQDEEQLIDKSWPPHMMA